MKLAINGALTIGTKDGANIEMQEAISDSFWPFSFGAAAEENINMAKTHSYHVKQVIEKHPYIAKAIEALIDGSLAETDEEKKALKFLHQSLIYGVYGSPPDRYFVLNDLDSYVQTQKKVERFYADPQLWAEMVIKNIAGMGDFSTDRSIDEYAKRIWHIDKCPVDVEILNKIRHDYSEMDRCRIF
jgi:starch phosphorylase